MQNLGIHKPQFLNIFQAYTLNGEKNQCIQNTAVGKCQQILIKFGTEHLNVYGQIPFSTTSNQHNL